MTELLAPQQLTVADVMRQGTFEFFEVHDTGIKISESCPEDDWIQLAGVCADAFQATGESHCRMTARLCDVLNYGFAKHGERASNIINATAGYMKRSAADLEKAMNVFLKIPEENRRVDELTVDHHRCVTALSGVEQREFLDKAIDEGWSVSKLKEAILERHPKNKTTPKQKTLRDPEAEKISEGDALAALTTLAAYFEQEEEEASVKTWGESRKAPFRILMKVLASFSRKLK